jgi:thiosulfate/3-mercaptopyruvate sulfurtransferase
MGNITGYARPELLAETGWLANNLHEAEILVVDVRSRDKYVAGHIPGAVWFDAGSQLKDPDDRLHAPRPEIFQRSMNAIGVMPNTTVIAYDESSTPAPARLWWVLDYYGHTNARILNGGWNKWISEGRSTETAIPNVLPGAFSPKVNAASVCPVDVLQMAITDDRYVIVDTRSAAEYAGTDVRAERGGHVPSAVNIEWQRNVTEEEPRVWRPAGELREMYEKAGVQPGKKVITYCQSAVRASHTLFTLRLLGHEMGSNYDGSWAEYGNRSDTEIAK